MRAGRLGALPTSHGRRRSIHPLGPVRIHGQEWALIKACRTCMRLHTEEGARIDRSRHHGHDSPLHVPRPATHPTPRPPQMNVPRISLAAISVVGLTSLAVGQNSLWSLQLGTTSEDFVSDVAGDGVGGVYVAGRHLGEPGWDKRRFHRSVARQVRRNGEPGLDSTVRLRG